jgi:F-type H+-transporting ATPase subunit alpha
MVATLNQPQYAPWPMEEQVVAIFSGINGYLDDVPTDQVPRFHDELREALRAEGSVYKEIRESKDLAEETEKKLRDEIERFKNGFAVHEERAAGAAA